MTRRSQPVIAALLCVAVVAVALASAVQIGTHRTTYEATPTMPGEAAEPTTPADLPTECRPVARSLAAGERVSLTEHRIALGPGSVVLRRTAESGWAVADALCGPALRDLGPSDPLTVDGESYRLLGQYERTTEAQMPLIGAVQLIGALAVPGLLIAWAVGVDRGGKK